MIPERLRVIESDLRKVIARRQYSGLSARLGELRRIADEYLGEVPSGHPLRLEIAHWMLDTIKWARLMVTTQRQIWSTELDRLPRVANSTAERYLNRADRYAPGVCLDL
ncbi:MAG: hypothetical protein ABSB15_08940 [Bryobacteraceae bacterium]|jgi:hypothetical protein